MRRLVLGAALIGFAVTASGSVFERFLSQDRPADRAIMGYLEMIKAGKASSMDYANVGVLILEKGFPGDAEDYLLAALKLDKHNYEAAYRLGLVLQREGRDREAVRYYKKTVKERPGYAQALFMLALAEERCGQREEAIHHYAKAYRHAPWLANPKVNPLVYDSDLQTEAALRHYQEVMRTSTLVVTEIDPAAIRRMMEIKAPPGAGEAKPEAPSPATPPAPRTTMTPQPAPAVAAPPVAAPAPTAAPAQGAAPVEQQPGKVLPGFASPGPRRQAPRPQPAAPPAPEPTAAPSPDEPAQSPEPEPEEPTPTPTPTR